MNSLEMLSSRKKSILEFSEKTAKDRLKAIKKFGYFHNRDLAYVQFILSEKKSLLDIGCGNGWLLGKLVAAKKIGVDLSPKMLVEAKINCPEGHLVHADIEDYASLEKIKKFGPFDYILLSDTLGSLDDISCVLKNVRDLCSANTRVVISHYNHLWEPVLKLSVFFGLRTSPTVDFNWLSIEDIANFCNTSGFEVVKNERQQLIPISFLGIGNFINRWLAPLPFLRRLNIRNYTIARMHKDKPKVAYSVTIVVPVKNEKGNIEAAIRDMPNFPGDLEIIFVEGNSSDGSWDEIHRVIKKYKEYNIKALKQPGRGKGNAVHHAFNQAEGDILIILDGDLTVPPKDMIKFYNVLASGVGEFANGTRLVYSMEKGAMMLLNYYANATFAKIFSFLLNQRFSDTLCGTKALFRYDYKNILANKSFFGDFDPFGDFDLIFGAAKLNLKIVEVPVRYKARSYGVTQISRFYHGVMLLKMVIYAYKKLKAI